MSVRVAVVLIAIFRCVIWVFFEILGSKENVAELNGCMKSLSVERGFGRVRLRRVRWLHEMPETSKSTSQTLVVRSAPWRRGVLSSVGCRSLGRVGHCWLAWSLCLSDTRSLGSHSLSRRKSLSVHGLFLSWIAVPSRKSAPCHKVKSCVRRTVQP